MTMNTFATALATVASLLTIAIAAPANADANREQAKANFLQADTNQDKQLDLAEFKTFINLNADHGLGRAGTVRRFGMYGRAFSKVDANQDGVVTGEEIAAQAQR